MKIYPYRRNRRYYNNAQDSILSRLKHVIGSFSTITWDRLKYFFIRKNKKQQPVITSWLGSDKLLPTSQELAITWLGHATFLIQSAGISILTDPVFYDISLFAPRFFDASDSINDLPLIDLIVISHNHRDHMDEKSLLFLKRWQPYIVVPEGNKNWFVQRGFINVIEATWWNNFSLVIKNQTIMLSCLPAYHWSGRGLFDINATLWASWLLKINNQSLYFVGDTAYWKHFKAIGKQYQHIDIVLMPIGPNEPKEFMTDTHINAEDAVVACSELNATHFIPMHWGTFQFGVDSFIEPINRLYTYWNTQKTLVNGRSLHLPKYKQVMYFPKNLAWNILKESYQGRKEQII